MSVKFVRAAIIAGLSSLLLLPVGACGGGDFTPDATFEAGAVVGVGDDEGPAQGFGGKPATDAAMPPAMEAGPQVAVCGDKIVQPGEACDDGNGIPGDGCSGLCKIEPGYTCPMAGLPCIYTVTMTCGNSAIEGSEACDDGNVSNLDGCSSSCQVEPGYACTTPGAPCTKVVVAACGDGAVNAGEQCDDGNASPGDGCSGTCKLESGYTCPTPGAACTKLVYCGDGVLQPATEQCDDSNAVPGDGCSGVCKLEMGYACPTPGVACVKIWVCGNGKVDPGEACDDSNTVGGDGCSADCSLVEPTYTCPNVGGIGGPCTKAPANTCGDGVLAGAEQCDDGNKSSSDGCSAGCAVEVGYNCPTPGKACKKIAFCGDGVVNLDIGEACDDGNAASGDGCTATCQLEPNYVCLTPGAPCTSTVKCGDSKVQGLETCDDGNSVSGDGCSAGNANPALSCQVEAGWTCSTPGARCAAKLCGDGILTGAEQCDDGNKVSNDGCSATCQIEQGFACTKVVGAKSVCTATLCGDNKKEGFEQCDDGNLIPYDGCSPTCTIEPVCSGGACTAVCGDGLKFPTEECDDGNTFSGDGCSATCKLETGFTCTNVDQAPPAQLVIPILYRDMRYTGTTNGHPDFQQASYSSGTGLVKSTLGPDGKPRWNGPNSLTSQIAFCWWYHDTSTGIAIAPDCGAAGTPNPYDKPVYLDLAGKPTSLTLAQQGAGANVYKYSNTSFFPVDGLGWNASGTPQVDIADDGKSHNFGFTSELHYAFTYLSAAPAAVFSFDGDDDVWAFINGKLIVDLGGVHGIQASSYTLNAANAAALGLVDKGMYSIDLFQAERHTTGSDYTLTLAGFVHTTTQCAPICGDGIIEGAEVCDDGVNDGTYGHCLAGCMGRGAFCGDALKQNPPEKCDDGTNLTTYGGASATACGPGCKFAPYCGDGVVSNGEQCDEGALNGTGYGHCTAGCGLGPRCGDSIKQTPIEECDDGVANGASGDKCSATCKLKCGNGVLEAGEQCDDSAANNVGGYGKCNPDCTLGPRCGDGFKNGAEQCDDGKNDGSYGTCTPTCTLANYCGDGTLTKPPEGCDLGAANSSSAYGPAACSNRCTPAPYCGDKAVDGVFGETCDDGVNSGMPGSCTTDCKSFVPLVTCGNGTVNPPEQCDDGANNGTAADLCDIHCRFKCGNGIKDPGETCDNGVNDGSYGGCTKNCQIAGYCGDGIKNGPETCDNGGANVSVATAYGSGICTTACTFAPYCGDGRVQSNFGEQCDGTASCDGACRTFVPK